MCEVEDVLFHSFFLAVIGNFSPIVQHDIELYLIHSSHKDMLSLFQRSSGNL
jgi:hypothetical protein